LADTDLLAAIAWAMCPYGLAESQYNPVVLSLAEDALATAPPDRFAARARLLVVVAAHAQGLPDPERRHTLLQEALTAARSTQDPLALGPVLAAFQLTGWHPDNLPERMAAADELAVLADQLDQPIFRIMAHQNQCSNFLELGDLKRAWAESDAIKREVGERSDGFGLPGISSRRAARLFLAGDLDAAEHAANELRQLAEAVGPLRRLEPLNLYGPHLMVIRFTQGRIEELLPLIRHADSLNPALVAYQAVLAMALARSGELDASRAIVRRLTANRVAALPRRAQWYSAMICLADSAELTGEIDAAKTLADQLAPYSGRLAVHGVGVSLPIDIALAQLALTMGDLDHATALAGRAVDACRRMQTPIFLGRALLLKAVALLRAGAPQPSLQALVDEALALAHRTGAHVIAQDAGRYHPAWGER
jgi:hypothetical protein